MYCVSIELYGNTSGSLGEREMLWEHESRASVSAAFSSSPKLSRVFLIKQLDYEHEISRIEIENMFSVFLSSLSIN